MSHSKKHGSDTAGSTKNPALWQIFFDENQENPDEDAVHVAGSHTVDTTNDEFNADELARERIKKTKTKKSGDGIVYQGILDEYGNSSDDEPQELKGPGVREEDRGKRRFERDHNDLVKFQKMREETLKESVLDGRVHYLSNENSHKPFNSKDWEPIKFHGDRGKAVPGERTRIRSESDLELAAWPSGRRKWTAPFRSCYKECSTREFWKHYIIVVGVALFMLTLYIGAIVAIVKGMN